MVLYGYVFLNLATLSAGFAAAGDWRQNQRLIALGLNALEIIVFLLGTSRSFSPLTFLPKCR